LLAAVLSSFTIFAEKDITDDILNYTNKFRKSGGFPELIMRDELNEIARKHSTDMASGRAGFGHDGFSRRYAMAAKKIKGMKAFAENVAYGARSGEEVVELWKKSTGHRRNMLGRYTYTGIGIAKDRKGYIYYTQVFAD
jgi:uncharacterized protein YkwD